MWDSGLISEDQFIGETSFNCAKFFKEITDNRRPKHSMGKTTLKFNHSNFADEEMVKHYFYLLI